MQIQREGHAEGEREKASPVGLFRWFFSARLLGREFRLL